ncbi:alpha/beta hydrolase [Cytophaga sp. FL35]|uniref:alpha/beta hydrolase n=1 Tax=Cytophaga sp. FL35 TaxID=1904456 RepID=UPI001653AB23|nr:alpha/beta hydrolase [Cytophaga sp. FL35]MBC6999128.1 alpha/beta fold hydrolase [Cytophaga sp. FL35]
MYSQKLDTLVDIGGYKMHFKIMLGEGTPILFEAGAGNDASVWNEVLEKTYKVTGTTLLSYDRSGFGQSELNPNLSKDADFGIQNGIKELEVGLSKLGFDKEIILVSHSYGGLYNLLYARKYPQKVKSIILIDATPSDFWNEELLAIRNQNVDISSIPKPSGDYYLNTNYNETMRYVRGMNFPEDIPILNIFPENSFPGFPEMLSNRWRKLHDELGTQKDYVTNIVARGSGHAVFQDNLDLVVNAIAKAYSKTLSKEKQNALLQNVLDNAIVSSIETRTKNRSEQDLNNLGYTLLGNEELDKALEVFKIATILFPESFNTYDSYGEALMKSNRKSEAIEMYEKSIELNPNNENGKQILKQLKD